MKILPKISKNMVIDIYKTFIDNWDFILIRNVDKILSKYFRPGTIVADINGINNLSQQQINQLYLEFSDLIKKSEVDENFRKNNS